MIGLVDLTYAQLKGRELRFQFSDLPADPGDFVTQRVDFQQHLDDEHERNEAERRGKDHRVVSWAGARTRPAWFPTESTRTDGRRA